MAPKFGSKKPTKKVTAKDGGREPSPICTDLSKERFDRLKDAKVDQERAYDLSTFGDLDLLAKYTHTGLLPLAISNNLFDIQTVRYFWANITVSGGRSLDSKTFTTYLYGNKFSFTIHDVCTKLGLSTAGVDPIDHRSRAILNAAKLAMGDKWDNRTTLGKLTRDLLPDDLNITCFILHHNLFPRRGNAVNEVPIAHLGIMKCIREGSQIDFRPCLGHTFLKFMTSRNLHFVPLPRLVFRILAAYDVSTPTPKDGAGPLLTLADVRRRYGSGLRRSLGDESSDDGDTNDDATDEDPTADDVPATEVPQHTSGFSWSHYAPPPPQYFCDSMDRIFAWQQQASAENQTLRDEVRDIRTDLCALSDRFASMGSSSRGTADDDGAPMEDK